MTGFQTSIGRPTTEVTNRDSDSQALGLCAVVSATLVSNRLRLDASESLHEIMAGIEDSWAALEPEE